MREVLGVPFETSRVERQSQRLQDRAASPQQTAVRPSDPQAEIQRVHWRRSPLQLRGDPLPLPPVPLEPVHLHKLRPALQLSPQELPARCRPLLTWARRC